MCCYSSTSFSFCICRLPLAGICLSVLIASGCANLGPHTRNGSLAGGAFGTALGALAGAGDGKALEGALIGGTAGALFGGALGNSVDYQEANDYAMRMEREQQITATAISIDQVIRMTQAGVDEQLIINQIHANGIERRLRTDELVSLKNSGVSNNVMSAMQTAPLTGFRGPSASAWGPRSREVIVEERWVHPPPTFFYHYGPAYRYCPPPRRACRPYSGWEISVGF